MSEAIIRPPYLRADETAMMMLHRHWVVFIYKVAYLLMLIGITIFVLSSRDALIPLFGTALFWGGLALFWIFFLTFIMLSWIHDELDLFIITDKRIISIEQVGPLTRTVSECTLDRVQEVNAEVSGILQTLLHYGRVHIHTASEHSDMLVKYAPHPVENANKIDTIINDYRNSSKELKI